MAAQGAFGTDFYDRSTRKIVGTMLWTEYRPVIKIGTKGALGSYEIRVIHSAPSLGQSIQLLGSYLGKVMLLISWSVERSKTKILGGQTVVKSSRLLATPLSNTHSLLHLSARILYTEINPLQFTFFPEELWNSQLG